MKRLGITIGAAVGAALVVLSLCFSVNAADSAKDEITKVEKKIVFATNTDQVMEYYDKEIVFYDYVPPLQYKGASAVRRRLDNVFNNAKDVKGEIVELNVVTDGKIGVAYSIQRFRWNDREGKPIEGTWRVTDVLHKVKGQWKVFHSHNSVPVDPVTDKGQMNLSRSGQYSVSNR
ncbi:MAG: YybH family protein [Candidatus Binataceae bacterium]